MEQNENKIKWSQYNSGCTQNVQFGGLCDISSSQAWWLRVEAVSEPAGSGADGPELSPRWKEPKQFKSWVTGIREDPPGPPSTITFF